MKLQTEKKNIASKAIVGFSVMNLILLRNTDFNQWVTIVYFSVNVLNNFYGLPFGRTTDRMRID